jgi:hypothetical protein
MEHVAQCADKCGRDGRVTRTLNEGVDGSITCKYSFNHTYIDKV